MKQNFYMRNLAFIFLFSVVLLSCKKENGDPQQEENTGNATLVISHKWESSQGVFPFQLGQEFIHSVNNDSLNFHTLKYYVSNIRLQKTDGTWWTQPESYYLVDLENGSEVKLAINNIPTGKYQAIEILYGVDSTRNVSGSQTGALSTIYGMFWTWNSGYIFVKAEGTAANLPDSSPGFSFHLSGFQGVNSVLTKNQYAFEQELIVTPNSQPEISMSSFVDRLWENTASVNQVNNVHIPGSDAKKMAKTFYGGFQFDHIHN